MRIQEGLAGIELFYDFKTRRFFNCLTLLWDEKDVVLLDTGLPGQLPAIKAAMEEMGIPFQKITKIIMTHQDIDHIGCLHEIVKEVPGIEVVAHELEKPYIEGTKPFIKPLEATTVNVFDECKPLFMVPMTVKVAKTVQDGDILPYCGGIRVVHTPGHTPGHISLLHIPTKTLITGDAVTYVKEELSPPPKKNTPDMETACASVKKLAMLDFDRILFYHGGLCDKDAGLLLREYADTL